MAYYVGDIPSEDLVIEPARAGEPIDLTPFTAADTDVIVRTFDGDPIPADFAVSFQDDASVVLEWPGASIFDDPGLLTVNVTLNGADHRERLAPVYLIVQDPDSGWHTIDTAVREWPDAPEEWRLYQMLELAKEQVIAYVTEPSHWEDPATLPDPVPLRYRNGQLMQARNLWNAGRVDPASGDAGNDGFQLTVYPLDWMVKQVLRPKPGFPVAR